MKQHYYLFLRAAVSGLDPSEGGRPPVCPERLLAKHHRCQHNRQVKDVGALFLDSQALVAVLAVEEPDVGFGFAHGSRTVGPRFHKVARTRRRSSRSLRWTTRATCGWPWTRQRIRSLWSVGLPSGNCRILCAPRTVCWVCLVLHRVVQFVLVVFDAGRRRVEPGIVSIVVPAELDRDVVLATQRRQTGTARNVPPL